MKFAVPGFSIKGFYFSSLALADDCPPTVFLHKFILYEKALQLSLKENFSASQTILHNSRKSKPRKMRGYCQIIH